MPNVDEIPELTEEDVQRIINHQLTEEISNNDIRDTIHSESYEDNGKIIPISEQAVDTFPNRIILKSADF